jgi:hypothetical protein
MQLTLAYRMTDQQWLILGRGFRSRYDHMEEFADINAYVRSRQDQRPILHEVPLGQEFGKYTLRIYPSRDTRKLFFQQTWVVYDCGASFLFTSIVCLSRLRTSWNGGKDYHGRSAKSAERAAATERDSMSSCAQGAQSSLGSNHVPSFVTSAAAMRLLTYQMRSSSLVTSAQIITSSLRFVTT